MVVSNGIDPEKTITVLEYLKEDMNKKVIVKIILPALDKDIYKIRSYKVSKIQTTKYMKINSFNPSFNSQIMQRTQNTHAYVNATFLYKFDQKPDKSTNFRSLKGVRVCFGSINPEVSKFLSLRTSL